MKRVSPPLKEVPISFVATYPPRRCGIGTFTHDLASAVANLQGEELGEDTHLQVIALNDQPQGYSYGDEVSFEIQAQNRIDYRKAADFLNLSPSQVVCIQHEFGIFGGPDGEQLITLLRHLKKPIVTTLHTVLREPSPSQRHVLKDVCSHSAKVVVLANKAVEMLTEVYDVPKNKIKMIHHGAPDVPFLDTAYYKEQFDAEGKLVILTFGLLNPNKGIEVAIEALAEVVNKFPNLLYIVLGATHPHVKRSHGEEYRISLEQLVKSKGLEKQVSFHNRFVTLEELVKYMVTADIYLTPYLSKEQISSGTLAYAVAGGKAIISTPYWHAEELLADGRGILVPFCDSNALQQAMDELIGDETKRQRMRRKAYEFGRSMIWREVASSYIQTFEMAQESYREDVVSAAIQDEKKERALSKLGLPEVNLKHLKNLTDDTGILQHAVYTVPNRYHGYTTDDNARAAIVVLQNWRLFQNESILPLMQVYLSFLNYALDPAKGIVRNVLTYDRKWLNEKGSEDSHGRMLWALGQLVVTAPNEPLSSLATQLFHQSFNNVHQFRSPRAWAFSILGALSYLKQFSGDRNARLTCENLGKRLLELFEKNSSQDWPWGEEIVSYENARLSQALIAFGRVFEVEKARSYGLKSLKWLLQIQTDHEGGHLSLIGNNGWFTKGGEKAKFDQQPVEACALIDACHEAYKTTSDIKFLKEMERILGWFLGQNDLGATLYNFRTGGCKDGLHSSRVNQNEGAESLLSWLMVLHTMHEVYGKEKYEIQLESEEQITA